MESIYIGLGVMFSLIGFGIFLYLLFLGLSMQEKPEPFKFNRDYLKWKQKK